jgi:peptidyl-prolyl cis-trans isomerase B (cyclophilin B)
MAFTQARRCRHDLVTLFPASIWGKILRAKGALILRVTARAVRGRFCAFMKAIVLTCVAGLAVSLSAGRAEELKTEKKEEPKKETTESKEQKKTVDTNEVAVIKTTEGEMVVEFWPDVAPKTVDNFKTLAKKGFYDGTCFHRVIRGFMIQGGDPLTKDPSKEALWGTGDPGYKIKAEFNSRSHVRGVISMARSNHPDSAGCQFFICHGNPKFLDGQYTAFGKLIKGDDVLEKIATTTTAPGDRPIKRMNIDSIKIVLADSVK